MSWDPFARGAHPVGVRSTRLVDAARDGRTLDVEVWYPAAASHAGQDLRTEARDAYELVPGYRVPQDAVRDAAAASGRFPLIVFSHGYGSHRRQSTFVCTHLASHGYVVAACDHAGNTLHDVMRLTLAERRGEPIPDPASALPRLVTDRPADVHVVIDRLLDGAAGDVAAHVDAERVGVAGHSLGGWTSLMVARSDRRVRALLPLAPAGGASPLPARELQAALDFAWGREVPTLFVVAERDSLLPLPGMHDLFTRTPSASKRMVVLENTDHMHFCDRAAEVHEMFRLMPPPGAFRKVAQATPPMTQLAPPDHAERAVRALAVAHFDATLMDRPAARAFLRDGLPAALAARGIRAAVH
jgi:predicted dienelactone hydrolase